MADLTYGQVFLTSLASGAVGGLIVAVSSYAIARLTGRQHRVDAAEDRAHQLELARRARLHDLRVSVYFEALELIEVWREILAQMDPAWEPDSDEPPLAIPDGSTVRNMQAKLVGCGSPEVIAAHGSWEENRRQYERLLEQYLAAPRDKLDSIGAKALEAGKRLNLSVGLVQQAIHDELTA